MEVREDGNMGPLKGKCEQKSERQNMSSLQCQAKEVPLVRFHKRRKEQVTNILSSRCLAYMLAFQNPGMTQMRKLRSKEVTYLRSYSS